MEQFVITLNLFIQYDEEYRNINYIKNEIDNNLLNKKIDLYSLNLPILKNNTNDVIEYVENNISKDKKKYQFWKLLENDQRQKSFYYWY